MYLEAAHRGFHGDYNRDYNGDCNGDCNAGYIQGCDIEADIGLFGTKNELADIAAIRWNSRFIETHTDTKSLEAPETLPLSPVIQALSTADAHAMAGRQRPLPSPAGPIRQMTLRGVQALACHTAGYPAPAANLPVLWLHSCPKMITHLSSLRLLLIRSMHKRHKRRSHTHQEDRTHASTARMHV